MTAPKCSVCDDTGHDPRGDGSPCPSCGRWRAERDALRAALAAVCDEAQQIVSMTMGGGDSRPDGRSVVSDETLDAARAVLLSDRKAGS